MPAETFRLGRYWIGTVPGSPNKYRFWYDEGTGEVRRRTLKTPDFEAAKIALAAVVLSEGSGRPEEPGNVAFINVLQRYWTEHSDFTRSRTAARLAGHKLLAFLGDNAKVGDFRKPKQREVVGSFE